MQVVHLGGIGTGERVTRLTRGWAGDGRPCGVEPEASTAAQRLVQATRRSRTGGGRKPRLAPRASHAGYAHMKAPPSAMKVWPVR
jgi:hypothetical protein